jgi:uncharacterized membrane protein
MKEKIKQIYSHSALEKIKTPVPAFVFLVLIVAIGLYFRIPGVNNPEGFSYAESFAYNLAIQDFPGGILKLLSTTDVHQPLYFFILHFWMKIFGSTDIAFRMFSLIIGILTIFMAYLTGKEAHCEKTGLIVAWLASINPLLIYFSSEVRFYGLGIFLGSCTLYFLIKIIKNTDKNKNYVWFLIFNILLFYTMTAGILFCFCSFLALSSYFAVKKEYKHLKKVFICGFVACVAYIPSFCLFYIQNKIMGTIFFSFFSLHQLPKIPGYLLGSLINFFSVVAVPFIIDTKNFREIIVHLDNIIFAFLPVTFIYFFIAEETFINKKAEILKYLVLFFFFLHIILACIGKYILMPQYIVLVLIPLVIMASIGLSLTNRHLCTFFCLFMGTATLIIWNNYFHLFQRIINFNIGYNIPAGLLSSNAPYLTAEDKIFSSELIFSGFKRYYKNHAGFIAKKTVGKHSIFTEKELKETFIALGKPFNNSENFTEKYLSGNELLNYKEKLFLEEVYPQIPEKRYLVFIFNNLLHLDYKAQQDFIKTKNPEVSIFLRFQNKTANDMLTIFKKHLQEKAHFSKGIWDVYIFQKFCK